MSSSKRIRIYTSEDVSSHSSSSSCWISRRGRIYNVTGFLPDHPGGDDLILKYGGSDVDAIMGDPKEHEHSDSAYDMMEDFVVGRIGNEATIVDESKYFTTRLPQFKTLTRNHSLDWEAPDDFHPENTDSAEDYEKNAFLDLRKPLLMQLLNANFRSAGFSFKYTLCQV